MLVSGTVAPQLFQRNGPLESQCTRACSKSGSFCADCRLCLAACCQALKNTAQNSIAMPARYPRHASKWHCGTPTVSTKRPAGITVHASMLKKRFLLRRLLSVPGCVLSSAGKHCTEQHSDAGKIPATNHASKWHRGTPTVSARRPAGSCCICFPCVRSGCLRSNKMRHTVDCSKTLGRRKVYTESLP